MNGLITIALQFSLCILCFINVAAIQLSSKDLFLSQKHDILGCINPQKIPSSNRMSYRANGVSKNNSRVMHLAAIGSLNAERESSRDAGITYFHELLKSTVVNTDLLSRTNYKKRCLEGKDSISNTFPVVVSNCLKTIFENDDFYKLESKKNNTNSQNVFKEFKLLLENSFIAAIRMYLDLTGPQVYRWRFLWFTSTKTEALTPIQCSIRANVLVELILELENHLYSLFRQGVTRCKMDFISKVFSERSKGSDGGSILKLTDMNYLSSVKKEYESFMRMVVPFFFDKFKINTVAPKILLKDFLKSILSHETNKNTRQIIDQNINDNLIERFVNICSRWAVDKDVDELGSIIENLNTGARSLLDKHIKSNVQTGKLVKMITNQQNQIESFKRQLESMGNKPASPLVCGFSYRLPDTNFNIIGNVKRGKGSIQITCVPDESVQFLGPYGFTQGVAPGNLGLSFNIDF
ncbi:hypothetical protein BdWA1_002308 [Babesia duncani]|uniref:Uncharacterized protein n=1 Tax=Babesia duncani TaxID=323732 RepID=A0AAD9UNC6_9APIC|nr:hypothetical protein BdWA1_002308 [Babesia duncani]